MESYESINYTDGSFYFGYLVDGKRDGLILKNVVATFSHQRSIAKNSWAERFVAFVRSLKYKN